VDIGEIKTHQYFLDRVVDLAKEKMLLGNGGPFAALIVKDGKILAEGWNQVTSTNDPTAHAEVVAIREACEKLARFQLEDCLLYASCEPCPMCLGAIYWARPLQVIFAATKDQAAAAGFDDAFIYRELDIAGEKRKIPFLKIQTARASEPFDLWMKKADRIEY
jgi:guanine deaminase